LDDRLRKFLLDHHTIMGPCFAAFPSLKCRGRINHCSNQSSKSLD
jgi:hypothetical protein